MNDHELAAALARRAGAMLADLQEFAASLPAPDDPTLVAASRAALGDEGDEFAHQLLVKLLATHRPEDAVLSEEGADDPARLAADRVWIVDPLDGTRQFAVGSPEYAVHIALWERASTAPGGLAAAAVYVPGFAVTLVTDDEPGLDAVDRNDVRLLVSRSRPPIETDVIVAALASATGKPASAVPFGSVGAKVAQIVSGAADLYVNTDGFCEWDLAAPMAVAVRHGLVVCDKHGNDVTFNRESVWIDSIVISRPEYVDTALAALS